MYNLHQRIENLRTATSYQAYQNVLPRITKYVNDYLESSSEASAYWSEEIAGFEYLFDASPLIIDKLKEHSYHITGVHSYKYRQHHVTSQSLAFRQHMERYSHLRALDKLNLFVPESPLLGGFGYVSDDGLINVDTLKFYEVLIGMQIAAVLPSFDSKFSVLEIGSGWGGFAYGFKKKFPLANYIIVDLPHTMLFSAVNMLVSYPKASFLFYGDDDFDTRLDSHDYDFCFIPNYAFNSIKIPSLDLGVNIASFQEMSQSQVDNYLSALSLSGCKNFYSLNRSCSPYNNELQSVFDSLEKYFCIKPISVLPHSYLSLGKKTKKPKKSKKTSTNLAKNKLSIHSISYLIKALRGLRPLLPQTVKPNKPIKPSKDYMHHCGNLR